MSIDERKLLIDKGDKFSIRHQCELLEVERSHIYYSPSSESEENLSIMRKLDEIYLETPFIGVEKLLVMLIFLGYKINHKRLRRLMKLVRWQTLYQKPKTTKSDKDAYKYPYLLKKLKIEHPNQVWEIDITYIPTSDGYVYLFAIIDVYSRYIVGWSLSNTMSAIWCCECIKEAIATYGKPKIINSDQGSQFTSEEYVNLLKTNDIQISMDSKGRYRDNIYIERFWRTVKYDYVYLNPVNKLSELYSGLLKYINFYNNDRPHQSIDNLSPKQYYEHKQAA